MSTSTKRSPKQQKAAEPRATSTGGARRVRRYLEALAAEHPGRGRRRTPDAISRRLAVICETDESTDKITQLLLIQERIDLEAELASLEARSLAPLEEDFVQVAKRYGERRGITYSAWRQVGVPAAVLRRAGISRSG